ncbi:SpoIIE family protein phosphatase [Streptomyces inhibens]|uniref:SpoIIE family protein phosphatase n=1 Tax=Streptomyces inhibens TaxID=2293571 RepID=UPI00378A10AE
MIGSAGQRSRVVLGPRSVAGQMFVVLVAAVMLLVTAATTVLVLQVRHDAEDKARARALDVAETFAHSPGMLAALNAAHPSVLLQPRAQEARHRTGVDFLVVTNRQGIRYTHQDPSRIGHRISVDISRALAGRAFTESGPRPHGRVMRAVVPITKADGSVVGVVDAGVRVENVAAEVNRRLPMLLGGAAGVLALATAGVALVSRRLRHQTHGLGPVEITRMYEHHDAVLHAVREGVLVIGGDGRLLLANDEARRLLDLPPDAEGRPVTDLGLAARTADLLASGRPATDEVHPAGEYLLAVNHRPTEWRGRPWGSVTTLRDTTELRKLSGKAEVAQERLKLLYDASVSIGSTLDVTRTAEELAEAVVPRFADFVTVDLLESVARGEEPAGAGMGMRRTAVSGIREDTPLFPVGELITFVPSTPQARGLGSGQAVLEPDLHATSGWLAQHPERGRRILDHGIHSLITVPLRARGATLGVVSFWRAEKPHAFEDDDLTVAVELVGRAALSLDNARRYTREHTLAVTLQRSLLPRGVPEQTAVEVAHHYLPARAGVGGDWFDVIPLSGARVALVVGDVVGHGLHAAATMGRLRTAVRNFAALDLQPDELLTHVDDLVGSLDLDAGNHDGEPGVVGATCLYAIYDPVSGRATLARAGHLPPALVHPDGTVDFPELPAGPPLGLGGLPFETAELDIAEGSQLVLFTDGLVEDRHRDIEVGLEVLRRALAHPDRPPQQTCTAVLKALPHADPSDDVALLVARTRALDREHCWDVPADPAAVADIRAAVVRQLADWGLDEAAFTTELVLSELLTNAIRYGTSPIQVRLLRERTLICEVSDGSSTSPHLRRAATTDEGGRGLFLVAQLTERWGTRYTAAGKVIWTEQPLVP